MIAKLAIMGKPPKSSDLQKLMARRLKAARAAYDPVAARVAEELGITPQTLNKYESDGPNGRFPDEMFLVKFARLTGCPTDWILLGRITAEMPAAMAARIGASAPELVAEAPLAGRKSVAERETS